jgi:Holliday junction resolvase
LKKSTKDSRLKNSIKKREIESLNALSEHYAKQELFRKFKRRRKISKNTNYKKGRAFEYRVKKHFEELGYYVIRSYASKGAQDLTAIKQIEIEDDDGKGSTICSEVLLIQCKNLKVERKLSQKECNNLRVLAIQTGGTPLLATNIDHKLKIEEIDP